MTNQDSRPTSPGPLRPLCWHALALAVGIGCGLPWPWWGRAAAVVAVLALALAVVVRRWWRVAFLCGLVAAAGVGFWRSAAAVTGWERQPLRAWVGRPVRVDGRQVTPARTTRSGEWFDLAVHWVQSPDEPWRAVRGRVRVYTRGVAAPGFGSRVTLRAILDPPRTAGNPGQFSQRAYLRRDGVVAVVRLEAAPERVVPGHGPWLGRVSLALRTRLTEAIARTMPGPCADAYADLLNSFVFGIYAAPVNEVIEDAFRRTGMVHLLVASGSQVSLLLLAAYLLVRLLPLPPAASLAIGGALLAPYLLVTGFEPSIVRAAVMGLVLLLGFCLGRETDLPTSLAAAAAVLLLAQPFQLGDIGFQLSFAACFGLAVLGVPLSRRFSMHLGRYLGATAGFTIAAQLCVAPVMLAHFRQLSLIGLAANLVAIPLSGLLVPLGLTASVVGLALPGLAAGLNGLAHGILMVVVAFVGRCSQVSWGYLDPVVLSPGQLAGLVAALGGLAVGLQRPAWVDELTRERLVLVGLAVVAAGTGWRAWESAGAVLQVTFLDVGHGDSILVRGPTGRCLLVDGGPRLERDGRVTDAGAERVVPALMLAGVRRLAAVVGTHQDSDHIGGLPAVVEAYPPTELLLPPVDRGKPAVARLLAAATRSSVPVRRMVRGDKLDLGGGAVAWCLWPPVTPLRGTDSDVNNNAVVLKVVYGRVSFLLASDVESAGTALLLRHAGDLSATVLKVPHQGAADACDEAFLEGVSPQVAVLSVGENGYGHPAPATLTRLAAHGIETYRTDRDGMVTIRTEGRTIDIRRYGRQ